MACARYWPSGRGRGALQFAGCVRPAQWKVAVDTDVGIDDVGGLTLLLSAPERVEIVLLSTVRGIQEPATGAAFLRVMLASLQRDEGVQPPKPLPPVVEGAFFPIAGELRPDPFWADSARDLVAAAMWVLVPRPPAGSDSSDTAGEKGDNAARAILAAARRNPGLQVLCIGPLTNVARALELDPSAFTAIGRLLVMGGSTNEKTTEFNFGQDPAAAHAVIHGGHGVPVILFPSEAVGAKVDLVDLETKTRAANRFGLLFRCLVALSMEASRPGRPASAGAVRWDTMVAAYLLKPDIFELRPTFVEVDAASGAMRQTRNGVGMLCMLAMPMDIPGFLELMEEVLCY